MEEEEQEIQKQNRQHLAQAKEKEIFGIKRVVQSAREEATRRREEMLQEWNYRANGLKLYQQRPLKNERARPDC